MQALPHTNPAMQPQFLRQQPANMESAVLPDYYAEVNDNLLTPWAVYRLCEVGCVESYAGWMVNNAVLGTKILCGTLFDSLRKHILLVSDIMLMENRQRLVFFHKLFGVCGPYLDYCLLQVLQDSQDEFHLFLSTECSSDSLNIPPAVWNQGVHRHCRPHQTDAWRQLDKAITSQEQLQWTVHREDMQGRVVKHVKFGNGSFSVRLT
eukprot:jgi/Chrzof1/1204/Cz01g44180.t1